MRTEFPQEERTFATDPERTMALLRRTYRLDARLLIALARVVGRPLFDFWVVEEEERLAGTTLVTYTERAGVLSAVTVHPACRRRGFAQALLARAHEGIRGAGRPYAALEVVRENAPARALYEGLGYRFLQRGRVLLREPVPQDPERPMPQQPGLRAFRRQDAPRLAELANAQASNEFRAVLPAAPNQFRLPPFLVGASGSQSVAWVVEAGGHPVAFLRATVGGIVRAAHFTQPLLAPEATDEMARALVDAGIRWVAGRSTRRIVTELPAGRERAQHALEVAGFTPAYELDTLAIDLRG